MCISIFIIPCCLSLSRYLTSQWYVYIFHRVLCQPFMNLYSDKSATSPLHSPPLVAAVIPKPLFMPVRIIRSESAISVLSFPLLTVHGSPDTRLDKCMWCACQPFVRQIPHVQCRLPGGPWRSLWTRPDRFRVARDECVSVWWDNASCDVLPPCAAHSFPHLQSCSPSCQLLYERQHRNLEERLENEDIIIKQNIIYNYWVPIARTV